MEFLTCMQKQVFLRDFQVPPCWPASFPQFVVEEYLYLDD